MPQAHSGFVKSLELLDPLLSVRWGNIIQQWVIERKSFIGNSEIEFLRRRSERTSKLINSKQNPSKVEISTYRGVSEEFISAKDGKRVILFANVLSDEIYNTLCAGDLRRYGGYSRYADELEAKEAREAKDKQRQLDNFNEALHKSVYDELNFVLRKRETELLSGKRNWKELLK